MPPVSIGRPVYKACYSISFIGLSLYPLTAPRYTGKSTSLYRRITCDSVSVLCYWFNMKPGCQNRGSSTNLTQQKIWMVQNATSAIYPIHAKLVASAVIICLSQMLATQYFPVTIHWNLGERCISQSAVSINNNMLPIQATAWLGKEIIMFDHVQQGT